MKTPSSNSPNIKTDRQAASGPDQGPGENQRASAIASLMGLGERSVQKSYYPQLQQKIRELEQSEHRYRLLAENISDVIWMLDLDLTIAYISPSIRRMSGHRAKDLIGRPFTDLLEPGDAKRFADHISQETANRICIGSPLHKLKGMELQQINTDGELCWIEVRISCMPGQGEQEARLLGTSRDITERKTAQKEKEEIQQQLLQAQKMESIGTLAGGIAHDFNNLLTVINGYANIMHKGFEPGSASEKKMRAIVHAGKRAEELTRQLLAFSRKQIFAPTVLDINQTLCAMDQMLRRIIGEDIHVETILEPSVSPISADQTQIEQVFTNLVVNARDSLNALTENKGARKRLTIETGQAWFNNEIASRLGLEKEGTYVFFSVSDNGRGMDEETRKRIFEPFFTTKSKYRGTGLGLAVIYGIVKQNHGSIRVYTEPGQGAMFKIYWPAAPKDAAEIRQSPAVHQEDLSGNETILLVEDDAEVLSFAANALMSLGYTVHKALNGKQALEWFKERLHTDNSLPQVVVTDLIMPEMNGTELVREIEKLASGLTVIFVSGHTDNHIVHNGMLEKGVNFLQKPYSQQRLAKRIRNALDQKSLDRQPS